ncbi:hypothetical protein BC833DRAFT_582691 [Globomyces pollinis-pini]|nr:hypothetical protein BC833DRAFT_582691 [Globomyces pollinis-pini]
MNLEDYELRNTSTFQNPIQLSILCLSLLKNNDYQSLYNFCSNDIKNRINLLHTHSVSLNSFIWNSTSTDKVVHSIENIDLSILLETTQKPMYTTLDSSTTWASIKISNDLYMILLQSDLNWSLHDLMVDDIWQEYNWFTDIKESKLKPMQDKMNGRIDKEELTYWNSYFADDAIDESTEVKQKESEVESEDGDYWDRY